MNRMTVLALAAAIAASPAFVPSLVRAEGPASKPAVALDAGTQKQYDTIEATITKGLDYLKTQQKADDGWQGPSDPPAFTALALKAFVQDAKYDSEVPFLDKGYDKLKGYQVEDGGIYKDALASYNTAIAISALASAKDPEYKASVDKAVNYLRSLQWTDKIQGPNGEKVDPTSPDYGGWGYSRKGHADGSNVQIAIDALHDAGIKPDDPAYAAALKFASRCQNLSETNDQPWAGNDGGFIYTPANGGSSFAGEYTGPDGKKLLRSYGSMTYAGLKSMIYAGLGKDDPRVKAAWAWIGKNYTVDENPGIKDADPTQATRGLYYYLHTMSRALHAYGEPIITDAQGKQHDWRLDLAAKLASMQKADGSWVGEKDAKWMEDNPVLTTSFAVLALEEVQADLKEHPVK